MRFSGLGLRGKFVIAILVAAALPFVLGLVLFESTGYQILLRERGKLHLTEALVMARALEQSSQSHGETLRTWIAADASLLEFIAAANRANAGRDADAIAVETRQLDEIWSTLPADDPRLSGVIARAAASGFTKYRELHPETAEIIVTDARGALVVSTGKSSDYDQADEAWWRKGAALEENRYWTDVLRFDASSKVYSLDIVMPLHLSGQFAGVVKMSVDVTSLFARLDFNGDVAGERWEIALPDGWVIASSVAGFVPMSSRLSPHELESIRWKENGWALVWDTNHEARMLGFVGMGSLGQDPNAYLLFSSLRDDALGPLQRRFLEIGLLATLVLTVCVLVGFFLIRRNILQPLASLGKAARSITATTRLHPPQDLDESSTREQQAQAEQDMKIIRSIRTGDEVETLASDFATMASRVLRYHQELESEVAHKTSVIIEDLEMAREFQHALLPSKYPEVPSASVRNPLRLQFSHFYQPAATVGGDFFDLIELDENRAGILIADVMGHGARSALVTAILHTLVRKNPAGVENPGDFLGELNQHLIDLVSRSRQNFFVTAFFLILDTRESRASWAVAGHPSPLRVRRGSGRPPQPLWDQPPHQPALGLMKNAVYHSQESPLKAGEVFLLFTDGALEAENPAGDAFGLERLTATFDEALDGPMAAMPAKIVCEVTAFHKRSQFDDDVCLVAVEALSAMAPADSESP